MLVLWELGILYDEYCEECEKYGLGPLPYGEWLDENY